ncbi:MAG: M23 family metallopeptidase [Alphaproteobacteria bacterium]|nr:M23 family metallopeptidase [Alphaproteobacteria bacterium]
MTEPARLLATRILAFLCLLVAGLLALSTPARAVELRGEISQGGLVTGQAAPGTRIALDGRALRISPAGFFAFGFGRDHAPEARLAIRHPDGRREERILAVVQRSYQEQRISGLPPRMVTPPPETLARIRREQALIAAARAHDTPEPMFAAGFAWPVIGPISGVYGSRRILNGEPRRPHFGVDVAMPTGTPIRAAAPGIVRLAEHDLYFTGGTVILDHGHGVMTSYLHMHSVEVRVGERVDAEARIGTVGATGRVTGAHLHWSLNWFTLPLDPAMVVPPMPAAAPPRARSNAR